jgi:hypothetical protein
LSHLVNEKLTAAQFFNRKHQPSYRTVIADTNSGNGVQVTQKPAFIDGDFGLVQRCVRSLRLHAAYLSSLVEPGKLDGRYESKVGKRESVCYSLDI